MPKPVVRAERNPKTSLVALCTSVAALSGAFVPLFTHYSDVIRLLGPTWSAIIIALGAIAIAATCVASASASILQLFPHNNAEHDVGTSPPSNVDVHVDKEQPPVTLLEDLGIAGIVIGDVETFAAGNPVSGKTDVFGEEVDISVVKLSAQPAAGSGYTVFSGSIVQEIEIGFQIGLVAAAGAPVMIAEKIGNTWYGATLAFKKAA